MSYLREGIRYPKPLSLNDRLLIETVCTNYGGVYAPFIAIDREDHVELRCPIDIKRVTPWVATTEATA